MSEKRTYDELSAEFDRIFFKELDAVYTNDAARAAAWDEFDAVCTSMGWTLEEWETELESRI